MQENVSGKRWFREPDRFGGCAPATLHFIYRGYGTIVQVALFTRNKTTCTQEQSRE
jgi:hypothetical protein